MDPVVIMKAGPLQEWRSEICRNGGKNPQWGPHQHFDVDVKHIGQELEIWVRNAEMMQGEPLGHAKVRLEIFKRAEVAEERIEIFQMGRPVGHIWLKSHYHPEALVVGGMMAPQVAVVQQPMMQQPMHQQPMMAPVAVAVVGGAGWNTGFLKLHL